MLDVLINEKRKRGVLDYDEWCEKMIELIHIYDLSKPFSNPKYNDTKFKKEFPYYLGIHPEIFRTELIRCENSGIHELNAFSEYNNPIDDMLENTWPKKIDDDYYDTHNCFDRTYEAYKYFLDQECDKYPEFM